MFASGVLEAVGVEMVGLLEVVGGVHFADAVEEGAAFFAAGIDEREAELQVGRAVIPRLRLRRYF